VGIALFSLVLLVIFGITAMVTLRYTLKPLREISESAIAISPRSIHARLPTEGFPPRSPRWSTASIASWNVSNRAIGYSRHFSATRPTS
jgi:hypothetical protein